MILDGDRNARQRTHRLACSDEPLNLSRRRAGRLGEHYGERVDLAVELPDARQTILDQLGR